MPTTKTPTAPTKAAPRKASTAASRRKAQGPVLPEDHTESEAVAHAIISESIDLTPSVNRIMNAGLSEAGSLHAINLFRDSLGVPGNPNRDPAVAIEASRKIKG
jgi:hypothetical protein